MRKASVVIVGLLLAGSLVSPAIAEPVPANATWEQVWFPSDDGTMLHADVFLPKDREKNERHPVILSIGPYFGSGGSVPPTPTSSGPVMRFQDLIDEGRIFERGYAYIQVDSRGYGGSDGCYDLGGAGEQMDAKAAVEWAAKQKWSNGKVGMWGKSYDAWTQVMALAQKPKGLAAAVIQSPLLEGYRGFFMNGVHYDAGWYATPGTYGAYDAAPPSVNDSPPDEYIYPAKGTATNPDCYAENMSMTALDDHSLAYWQERDIRTAAGRSDVPVLWSHGFLDADTKPDNFLDVWSSLDGPKRAWFGQYDHVRGNEDEKVGRDGFMNEAMAWFDHYLKGKPLKTFPPVEVQDNNGSWRSEKAWPPADASGYPITLNEGSYDDMQGNSAVSPDDGAWTFTPPAPYDLHFAGAPRLRLTASTQGPQANLIALLYDVAPDGEARLITRGAYLINGEDEFSFDLYPQDWRLERGHRFGVFISGSDDSWFNPISTATQVSFSGQLELPFLRFLRPNDLEGGPAFAMASVPKTQLDRQLIMDNTGKTEFPPPLKRRLAGQSALAGEKKKPPVLATRTIKFEESGSMIVPGPTTRNLFGITEFEFAWVNACASMPASQGLDGWVVELPEDFRNGIASMEVLGADATGAYDLDVYFYDASCTWMRDVSLLGGADESGPIPPGATWAFVSLFAGANATFDLTATVIVTE